MNFVTRKTDTLVYLDQGTMHVKPLIMMPLVMVNLFAEKERNERTYFYVVSHLLDSLTIDATMVYLCQLAT